MLVGDFNFHYNKPTKSDVSRFVTLVASYGFCSQHVDKPTHRCGNILDLVLTRPEDHLIHGCEVDEIRFTIDHFMVNCVLNLPKPNQAKFVYTLRKYSNIDHSKFSEDLANKMQKLESINYNDINKLVDDYTTACCEVLDTHAPAVTRTCKPKCQPGWYTDSVIKARRERRKCERHWRKTKSDYHLAQYQASKKHVKDTILNAKSVYFKDKLSNCSPKDMYSTVNMLLNKQEKQLPDSNSPKELANNFGQFFTSKIQTIRDNLDSCNDCTIQSSVSNCNNSMSKDKVTSYDVCTADFTNQMSAFRCVTVDEVHELVKKSPNKSCMLDPLPTWLIKQH